MTDFTCFVNEQTGGRNQLYLQVEGMHCASCAWRIESALSAHEGVQARVNFSTERLNVTWPGDKARANDFAREVESLGFHVAPFNQMSRYERESAEEKFLLRCLAVSGFVSGNLMIFSLALWFAGAGDMGQATRGLMHWIMALLSLPAIIYSGRPFFRSAWETLKHGRSNMDVPISLAVILAALMSLHETVRHGPYVYFDASVMLLFFLLVGRYLDKKARGRAREAAQGLLAMLEGTATILDSGTTRSLPMRDLRAGMRLVVTAGEKIAADGTVESGESEVDSSLITGETMPRAVRVGEKVYGGMINLAAPIEVRVQAAGEESLLADIVSLMEKAEQAQAAYVRLADRVAEFYTPVVHLLAVLTFLGWWLAGNAWQVALMNATAVLIITCPCALGLAVPVVQVLASGMLFKRGMLLKSGNALEKLASIDTVAFDKTGTLTLGTPTLINAEAIVPEARQLAASLAAQSKHPLAKAVAASWDGPLLPLRAKEIAAHGLEASWQGKIIRLGRRSWCGDANAPSDAQMELWLNEDGAPIRFTFADQLRPDAAETVEAIKKRGLSVLLLSGDRPEVAQQIAARTGIGEIHAGITPVQKNLLIEERIAQGHRVLMIGDGLNDAPALSAATASMSPSSGVDITQNAADIVFRGKSLRPVLTAVETATRSQRLVHENLLLSLVYNVVAVPLAVVGLVTPLIAAIAMSSSSLIVIANSFRLKRAQ